jgi:hypothetical protein
VPIARRSRSPLLDFEWHVFSYNHRAAKTGDHARNAYRRINACDFVVLSGEARQTFGFRCHGKPPDLSGRTDILVAPTTMTWTMAFTHEQPTLGPYFAEA